MGLRTCEKFGDANFEKKKKVRGVCTGEECEVQKKKDENLNVTKYILAS